MSVVALMFSPSSTGGFSQDEAICAELISDLIAEARGGRPMAAAIRSGGLLLHNFAYRRLEVIVGSGHRSFLNVFQRMGAGNNAPLSSPHPGLMLSLDLSIKKGSGSFLDGLDDRVLDAGGRLYFAKDSRRKAHLVPHIDPRLDKWRAVRNQMDPEGVFISDLARRLNLVGA